MEIRLAPKLPHSTLHASILYLGGKALRRLAGTLQHCVTSCPQEDLPMAISIVVSGTGFMGREILAAVAREPDLEPVGVIEKFATQDYLSVPGIDGLMPM